MSTLLKLQLSRLGMIATATAMCFSVMCSAALAQAIPDMKGTAEVVASMNTMQILAYIAISSIFSNVIVIGFYVKSVAAFQKESAVFSATMTAKMSEMAAALHGVSENCKYHSRG